MIAVIICSMVNLALLVGMLGGIITGLVKSRAAIERALSSDPALSGVRAAAGGTERPLFA